MKLADLHEESIGDARARWTPAPLSDEQIIEWCKENASRFLSQGTPIFRGTAGGLTGVLDTTKLQRGAGHSYHGYYNLWIDNDEMWEGFPKRSGSVVCSTSRTVAHDYGDGDIYLIVPSDSALIGVCSHEDMWGSFEDNGIEDLNDFFDMVSELLVGGPPANKNDWATFKLRATRTTLEDIDLDNAQTMATRSMGEWFVDEWKKGEYSNMFDFLQELLDPYDNGFEAHLAKKFDVVGNKEVWVGGHEMQIQITGDEKVSGAVRDFLGGYYEDI